MTAPAAYAPDVTTTRSSFDTLLQRPDDAERERERLAEERHERLERRPDPPPPNATPVPVPAPTPVPTPVPVERPAREVEPAPEYRSPQRAEHRTIPLEMPELGLTAEDMAMLKAALVDWAQGSTSRVKRYGDFCWRHPEFVVQREEW